MWKLPISIFGTKKFKPSNQMTQNLIKLAQQFGEHLTKHQQQLVTAESCTGGWIAQTVTEVAGCSRWFERGFVCYSNASKQEMLEVSELTLQKFGAVSTETVIAMASGALAHSPADCAVAVSGIAGPDGGTVEKPVGTIFLAWQWRGQVCQTLPLTLQGNRHQIREQVVGIALNQLLEKFRVYSA